MRARVLERDDRWVVKQRATLDAEAVHDERREAYLARSHTRNRHQSLLCDRERNQSQTVRLDSPPVAGKLQDGGVIDGALQQLFILVRGPRFNIEVNQVRFASGLEGVAGNNSLLNIQCNNFLLNAALDCSDPERSLGPHGCVEE